MLCLVFKLVLISTKGILQINLTINSPFEPSSIMIRIDSSLIRVKLSSHMIELYCFRNFCSKFSTKLWETNEFSAGNFQVKNEVGFSTGHDAVTP